MGIESGYIPVLNGTLTFPWGDNGQIIEVLSGIAQYDPVEVGDTSGPIDPLSNWPTAWPGSAGGRNICAGDFYYRAKLVGSYVAKGSNLTTISQVDKGTVTLQLGSGETWAGPAIIYGIWTGKWNANKAQASYDIIFDGVPTITKI